VSLQFHPGAAAEHLDQVAWYEARQAGLGARYLAAVSLALEKIEEAPGRFPRELLRAETHKTAMPDAFRYLQVPS
jgi:hypothetical protein